MGSVQSLTPSQFLSLVYVLIMFGKLFRLVQTSNEFVPTKLMNF